MLKIVGCLHDQHDPRLVVVAGIVCLISCLSAVQVWRRGMEAPAEQRKVWLILAGSACGFGIWGTHFIASLAFMPGVSFTYDLPLVAASLFCAVIFTTAGLSTAGADGSIGTSIASGCIVGLGIATMHYLGAQSMYFPGRLSWDPGLIGLSILTGVTAAIAALAMASRPGRLHMILAGSLLALAVVGLHFIAMSGMEIVLDPRVITPRSALTPKEMTLVIGAVALTLLCIVPPAAFLKARAAAAKRRTPRNADSADLVTSGDLHPKM